MRKDQADFKISYIDQLYGREDVTLQQVRSQLGSRAGMALAPHEGRLLQVLMTAVTVQKAVEIGTLHGLSAVWIARALAPQGHLWTLEKDPARAAAARQTFVAAGVDSQITICEGDARTTLASLDGLFDMVFIDANKSAYCEYLQWATEHVRSGGLLVADNTLLFGSVYASEKPDEVSRAQWDGMRLFNEKLANDERWLSVLIPTSEGFTVAVRK